MRTTQPTPDQLALLMYAEHVLDEDQESADDAHTGYFTEITSPGSRRIVTELVNCGWLSRITVRSSNGQESVTAHRITKQGILALYRNTAPHPNYDALVARETGRGSP